MRHSTTGPEVSTIGKYQLIANLGHGGMADVYLAVVHGPVGFNKLTVIKRLRPSLADEPEFLAMFLDEARLAARLNHPNVVQTNEVAEYDGVYFIAMEYLDGQPLNRLFHKAHKLGEMPRDLLLRVVADALAGLHHAHELRDYDGSPLHVVHRDASPHNIFVTYDGQTKLVDFGIAKAATRSAETRGGVLKGKIAYMAPEQPRSGDVDRRADIYAMGLVMWEALAGQRMRKGSDLDMLDGIARGETVPLSSVWPEAPAALSAIIDRATAFAKNDRYATANEMRQDILDYLSSTSARTTAEEVGKLVSHLFESKRTEMKGIIERQLSGLRRASTEEVGLRVVDVRRLSESSELPRVSMASLSSSPSAPPPVSTSPGIAAGSISSHPPATTGTSGSSVSSTLASPASSNRLRAPIAIFAIAIAAAVTVLMLRRGGDSSASALPPTGAPPPVTATAASPAETSKATDTVELRLSARPSEAKMFLDDTALGTNPFVGRFHKDEKPHTLRVEADGHASITRPISFATDQTVEMVLAEAPKDKPTSSAAAPSRPGPAGDDVKPPQPRPKKQLDSDDPWK